MKPHVKNIMNHFGLGEQDVPVCEGCGQAAAVDAHHCTFRSQGGSDEPDNIVLLCRSCHEKAHSDCVMENALKGFALMTKWRKDEMERRMYGDGE